MCLYLVVNWLHLTFKAMRVCVCDRLLLLLVHLPDNHSLVFVSQDVEMWTLPEEQAVTDVGEVSNDTRRELHAAVLFIFNLINKQVMVFVRTEKTTDAKLMKAGGTEIGKTLAEKSRGLFSANDWQCKTWIFSHKHTIYTVAQLHNYLFLHSYFLLLLCALILMQKKLLTQRVVNPTWKLLRFFPADFRIIGTLGFTEMFSKYQLQDHVKIIGTPEDHLFVYFFRLYILFFDLWPRFLCGFLFSFLFVS